MLVRERLILSELDAARLRGVAIQLEGAGADGRADEIFQLLDLADVVPSTAVQPDVVTMRSRVVYDDGNGGRTVAMTLAYPDESDVAAGRLSVLSPLGFALLGARVGDVVEYDTPDGARRKARVREVTYQPEASGDLQR